MTVRTACIEDLENILPIYSYAREQMALNGNPTQWGNDKPPVSLLINDIKKLNLYLIEENDRPVGVFAFIIGVEPTYQEINGAWLNALPYGTVHRVASNGVVKGILNKCLNFCESLLPNIRIDTHKDNAIMRHLLEKEGFQECGIIHVEDGTPRIAYQRMAKNLTG
ncbi:MAG: N-acetyltransferase [Clostridium sp.]|nr:N-acetyltransferase [Clostridium sp.]